MRSILTLIFAFCAITIGSAQNITAFLTNAEVEWLNKEISSLEDSYNKMQEAMRVGDNNLIAENKRSIIKSVNRMATNCKISVGKIDYAASPEVMQRRTTPDSPNYFYNRQKNNKKLQEINVSETSLETLRANSDRIAEIRNTIKKTRYRFTGDSEITSQNIIFVAEILNLAKSNNSIINASLAEK